MDWSSFLSIIGQVTTVVSDLVKFYDAVQSGLPVAVSAWNDFQAVVAAGGVVTQAQWAQAVSDIATAQQGLDQAIDQAEGTTAATSATVAATAS